MTHPDHNTAVVHAASVLIQLEASDERMDVYGVPCPGDTHE